MYGLIQKLECFLYSHPTDLSVMQSFAHEFSKNFSGINADILIGWLQNNEWPKYQTYDWRGIPEQKQQGNGDGNGSGICNGITDGNGFVNGEDDRHGKVNGIGYGQSIYRLDGVGNGIGSGSGEGKASRNVSIKKSARKKLFFNKKQYLAKFEANFTLLSALQKVNFSMQYEKDQWVITRDQEGGCIFGQYQSHCGREVWLANTRHLWGWEGGRLSVHDIAALGPVGSNIRIGASNPELLVLLACGVIIAIPKHHAEAINNLPVDSTNEVP